MVWWDTSKVVFVKYDVMELGAEWNLVGVKKGQVDRAKSKRGTKSRIASLPLPFVSSFSSASSSL